MEFLFNTSDLKAQLQGKCLTSSEGLKLLRKELQANLQEFLHGTSVIDQNKGVVE